MEENEVFWIVLAATFLALAIVSARERRRITTDRLSMQVWGLEPEIASAVYRVLAAILIVELAGFVLAAAAAFYSGLA